MKQCMYPTLSCNIVHILRNIVYHVCRSEILWLGVVKMRLDVMPTWGLYMRIEVNYILNTQKWWLMCTTKGNRHKRSHKGPNTYIHKGWHDKYYFRNFSRTKLVPYKNAQTRSEKKRTTPIRGRWCYCDVHSERPGTNFFVVQVFSVEIIQYHV